MPMIFIRHVGANLAYVEPLGAVDPGFGVGGGGVDPGYDHPIFGPYPGHGLPGGGHISNRPPMNPNFPDNSLPAGPPVGMHPGEVVVLVRDPEGVWHYHALAPSSPPPRPLPEPPPAHGPLPPGGIPHPGGGPVTPPVYPSGQPLPPTAQPTRR
jgi:hypothetical protein